MENQHAPKINHEKLREFQDQVMQHASRTQHPSSTTPTPTSDRPSMRLGQTSAFKRALENAENESKRRLNSPDWQAEQEARQQALIEQEKTRRNIWLDSIDSACSIPIKVHGIGWNELDNPSQPQVIAAGNWVAAPDSAPWLYLSGPIGRGKTVLASLALRGYVKQQGAWDHYQLSPDRYGLFIKARQLIASLRPYGEGIERYMTLPVLVIDDIGTETVTSWGYEHLLSVIDERYDNHMTTIITSNLPLTDGEEHGPLTRALGDGGRIADRILEVATEITFTTDDPNWRRV